MRENNAQTSELRREWLIGAALTSILVVILSVASFWRPVGDMLFDALLRSKAFEPNHQIVIITIDDRSITELGGWPLNRDIYADLLDRLAQPASKPRVIGFNLLFLDPSSADDRLAASMATHSVVLPVGFGFQADGSVRAINPVQAFANVAELAHINAVFESDGSVRGIREYDSGHTHFSLRMHQVALKDTPFVSTLHPSPVRRVRMMDPGEPYLTVSLVDALNAQFLREQFKDKYVLLGVTSSSLGDRFSTLYSGQYNSNTPGVAVLASALQADLTGRFIDVGGSGVTALFNLIGLSLMLIGVLYLSPVRALIGNVLLLLAWVGLSDYLLSRHDFWLDPTPLMLTALLFQALWAWRRTTSMVQAISRTTASLDLGLRNKAKSLLGQREEFIVKHTLLLDQAVQAAKGELDFLSSVIEQLPDALSIFGADKKLLLSNSHFNRLRPGSAEGSAIGLETLSPWLGIAEKTLLEDQTKLVKITLQTEAVALTREMMLRVSQIETSRLGCIWIVVLSDISELRRLESQRDRALNFLSHDMRTPVSSILAISRKGLNEPQKIEQHAKRLLEMMDDFCMAMVSDEPAYQLETEMLENVVYDAIDQVRDLAESKQIQIQTADLFEPAFVKANARLLVRALTNILQNAVKFAPMNSTVFVSLQLENQQAILEIVNNIETNRLETLSAGFGLGLQFVETVIAKHNGQLIRAIPPTGQARVTVALPLE